MVAVKKIDQIEVKHIRGISSRTFKVEIFPNRPTIMVAPNGSGKSSLAAAFAALKRNRLEVHKDQVHLGEEGLDPLLRITFTDDTNAVQVCEATKTSSDISTFFDVSVINSQLVSKAKQLRFNGMSVAQSAIEVEPVILIPKIPQVAKLAYVVSDVRTEFGPSGKLLPNMTSAFSSSKLLAHIGETVDFSKAHQVGSQKPLHRLKENLQSLSGISSVMEAAVDAALVSAALAVVHIAEIVTALKATGFAYKTDLQYALAAFQLNDLWLKDKANFKAVVTYSAYEEELAQYQRLFANVKGTWKKIKPARVNGAITLQFPKANQISNGERDLICFLGQLMRARVRLGRANCILVIDEIFDYLDDANLVASQYYLSQMMIDFKAQGRQLFPIILTHLDPGYFKTFVFPKQRIAYLNAGPAQPSRAVENIVIKRNDPSIDAEVSRAYFHFAPTPAVLNAEFQALALDQTLADSNAFYSHVNTHLQRYKNSQPYDPIAVSCAIRVEIERKAFVQLKAHDQAQFLATHTTTAKLEFAEQCGVLVPEIHYLLGLIYNAAMHMQSNRDNFSPLVSKLDNLTIRHMITSSL